MNPQRRKYILEHLGKVISGDNWLRISEEEFDELGGRDFFEGCWVEYVHDSKYFTTRVGQRGWDKEQRIQLPWKIHAPVGGGWMPPRPFNSPLDPVLAAEIINAINGTDITMEHHVNRQTLVAVVKEAKVEYQDLYTRFKDLYFGVATARLSAYIDGKIAHTSPVLPGDAEGVVGILPDLSDQFDDLIQMLEMDVREVLELTEDEYQQFVDHRWDNTKMLTEAIARLERLA